MKETYKNFCCIFMKINLFAVFHRCIVKPKNKPSIESGTTSTSNLEEPQKSSGEINKRKSKQRQIAVKEDQPRQKTKKKDNLDSDDEYVEDLWGPSQCTR